MAETYCGKRCTDCGLRETLNCPGCKDGPGRPVSGVCELAQCCRSKGHAFCDTCNFRDGCGKVRSREQQPDYRRRKQEMERRQQEKIARRSLVLGKWLWVLFWLNIPGTVAGLMVNNYVAGLLPGMYWAGVLLSAACSVAYGLILLKLGAEETRYRTAGICGLVSTGVSALLLLVYGMGTVPAWSMLITLPMLVVSLVREYNEYTANAVVLADVDRVLSDRWTVLWKWAVACFAATLGGTLGVLIVPVLGLLVVMAGGIGTIVVSILKLIYLYRSAKTFREYE